MQRYAFETAQQLVELGQEVTVATVGNQPSSDQIGSIRVCRQLTGYFRADRRLLSQLDEAIDVWHCMNIGWLPVMPRKRPFVLTVYGNDVLQPNVVGKPTIKRWLPAGRGDRLEQLFARWVSRRRVRKAVPACSNVISISHFTAKLFQDKFPQHRIPITIGYVGVSDHFFGGRPRRFAKSDAGTKELVSVCRLDDPRKNIDSVLRALALMRNRFDFRYTVVGSGYLRKELERLAAELGIAERVRFLGKVCDVELIKIYERSDLFVLASLQEPTSVEGFGIVYLEANASGLPVLAARNGGVPDAVADGKSGFFTDNPTPHDIAIQLMRFLDGTISFRSEECRQHAEQFRWPRIVTTTLECYRAALTADTLVCP